MTEVLAVTESEAFCGIDVAFAKGKRLPVCVCRREPSGGLTPLPLRSTAGLLPPRGSGNWATLDETSVEAFAEETVRYLREVESRFGVRIARVAIDAPRDYAPDGKRRASEQAMDGLGISCFATPSRARFEQIREAVAAHRAAGGEQARTPFANQLWMLVGFALFERLEKEEFDCIEVFPHSIVQALERGVAHKRTADGFQRQAELVAAATGCADATAPSIAFGSRHDRLDALMAAWVASLPADQLEGHGDGFRDTIWAPRRRPGPAQGGQSEPGGP